MNTTAIQWALAALGFDPGPLLSGRSSGLVVDGIAGRQTIAALKQAVVAPKSGRPEPDKPAMAAPTSQRLASLAAERLEPAAAGDGAADRRDHLALCRDARGPGLHCRGHPRLAQGARLFGHRLSLRGLSRRPHPARLAPAEIGDDDFESLILSRDIDEARKDAAFLSVPARRPGK